MADLPHVSTNDPNHAGIHNTERDRMNQHDDDIASKITAPPNPGVGALVRWSGTAWETTKMRLFEGEGSPEGQVGAPVGSRYVDTTAAGGVAEWFKATGSGNTGWQPLSVAIGWTNFTPGTGFAHVAGNPAQVSMVNGVVFFQGQIQRTLGAATAVGTIPASMAPPKGLSTMVRAGTDWIPFLISSAGAVSISSALENNKAIGVGSAAGVPYRVS